LKKFLLIFNILNTALYFIIYAYFDYILQNLSFLVLAPALISFLKILFLIIIGFSIGLIISIIRGFDGVKSIFDYKAFIWLAIIPAIMLILSGGQITDFIVLKFFNSNKKLSELVFYFFSRDYIWSLLIGIFAGVSIKLCFKKSKHIKILNNFEVKQ